MINQAYSRLILFLLGSLCAVQSVKGQTQQGRTIRNFDKSWRFLKEDAPGAEQPSFDDSKWRTLNVPHDWSIEGPIAQTNPTGSGGGYMPAGIGWYRKTFTVAAADAKRKVSVEFDGVMANSEVFVNGVSVGKRPYGYVSFTYDITSHLNFGGKPNIIAVRVDNSAQPSSRWYTGAGIYRHVHLVSTGTTHFDQWGVFIRPMQVTAQKAFVNVQAKVTNESAAAGSYTLQTTLIDPKGKTVKTSESKQTIAAGKTVDYTQTIEVANPALWDTEHPQLYKAITKLVSGAVTTDAITTPVGIREAKFLAATGFWLNGKNLKMYGVCLHEDGGAVGSAIPLAVWERRFKQLKAIGANAIRTAHNEVAPEFLDLCDRMGMLVMDETFDTWEANKVSRGKEGSSGGYHLYFKQWWDKDTRNQVLRDRNHPSIVIYSVGNEIHDNLKDSTGFRKYKMQQDLIHSLDPSRPVTMALLQPNGTSQVYKTGFAEQMDIVGQNYRENELVAYHNEHPDRIVIGTENTHVLNQWLALRDNAFMSGQFLWTGVDYLGEDVWPSRGATFGLLDRTGGWHTNGLQRAAWWSAKPVVFIQRSSPTPPRPARVPAGGAPAATPAGTPAVLDGPTAAASRGGIEYLSDWTPADLATYTQARVQVFSNADETELFLNGKSLGVKHKSPLDSALFWKVPFEKGTLKAVARNKGKEVATDELKTAGEPAKIILTADKSKIGNNWDDVSFVTATIVDANGVVCPNSNKLIQFSVSGGGGIAAVDNADRNDHDPYQATERKTYKGTCIALIKTKVSTGKITIKASAQGLTGGVVTIDAMP
ncbi:glycoside hydrolase family 2 TIM barrel-domain containing protein [Hymenobacter sp. GOD-10R]|uniref:glycoside hydrolase family 2 TIM barrel-domain containing protein n=1 Tax=Hymenobacter sp. GOD-10R TaxID=3093922 RepID=UPI002D7737C1|nr:glycoside hydrolase family 2 TIM barrel-domain containing protein [Hymenobacter sp. GOD-10R]WRQ27677.1 glycoside hydrolase family 2 TIM barrel-domain containing protein [Hymenobacter sp. GOD-10R]